MLVMHSGDTSQESRVSKLVFYAQSTRAVISGQYKSRECCWLHKGGEQSEIQGMLLVT